MYWCFNVAFVDGSFQLAIFRYLLVQLSFFAYKKVGFFFHVISFPNSAKGLKYGTEHISFQVSH